MQYALVDGHRSQPSKGMTAICEQCKKDVIAKCGDIKIHHWSHKGNKECDNWWEPETVWHRSWKNNFPETYREVCFKDLVTSELHRADIHTEKFITVEFQNSAIKPAERISRETFYKNLVWVVNGNRLKNDFPRFEKGLYHFALVSQGVYKVNFPQEYFPKTWMESSVPVIFDFLLDTVEEQKLSRRPLYCLLPTRLGRYALVAKIARDAFIQSIINGNWLTWVNSLLKETVQVNREN